MESSEHTRRARVLFDEAHSESWSIRTEIAERMQAAHPADASLAAAAAALERRDFEVAANDSASLDAATLGSADVLVIAHPSEPRWESTTGVGEPRLGAEEIEAIVSWVESGGGLIVLGETEQEKYGNNLNELLGRFGDRDRERDRPGLRAPQRRRAELDPREPRHRRGQRRRPACRCRRGLLLPGRHAGARQRRADPRPCLSERFDAGRTARRGDDPRLRPRRRPRRLRPVRRRLHRRARPRGLLGQPRLLRRRAGLRRRWRTDRVGSRRRSGLAAAPRRGRGAAQACRLPTARSTSTGPTRPDCGSSSPRSRRRSRRSPRTSRTRAPTSRRSRAISTPGSRRGSRSRTSWPRVEAFRPEQDRRDGIEHLVVFPMYKQNGSPDTCFEALIVRVPWPRWAVELEQPLRQREVPAGRVRRLHVGLRLRVRGPVPGDVLGRRAPAGPLRRRSSATARRSASAASAAAPPRS